MLVSIIVGERKRFSIMLCAEPALDAKEAEVVHEIEDLRRALGRQLFAPHRWFGSLRRLSFARAIQGSNSIEGFSAALDDVVAAAVGGGPLGADTEAGVGASG